MLNIFMQLLNMSFTASFVIVFVLAARLALKKVPKIFSYALWSVVLFRLLCPFSIQSMFSFLPVKSNILTYEVLLMQAPQIDSGIKAVDNIINSILPVPAPYASINPLQIIMLLGVAIWLLGVCVMAVHSIINLSKLSSKLKAAKLYADNIYISDKITTAFVMGVIKPKIYLPQNLNTAQRRHILLHEQTHIKRLDHIVKIVGFFTLCIHWFNPFVWLAFFISSKDMEMACDEKVIKSLGNDIKKEYSASLLSLATGRHFIGGTPLAFGEGDTKSRIKNVLCYKKPAFWVIVAAIIAVAALCFGLLLSPQKAEAQDKQLLIQFPAYSQRTQDNAAIFDIEPFYLHLTLPAGWTVKEKGEGDIKYPLMGAWSPLGIYDDKNRYIGAVGYNIYEEYEGSEDVPQAIYNQIALGNNYQFDAQLASEERGGAYKGVVKKSRGETAVTLVYTSANISKELGYDGKEVINKGILSYNNELLVYIAIELDGKRVSEQEQLRIAQGLKITSDSLDFQDFDYNVANEAIKSAILQSNKSEYHPADAAYAGFKSFENVISDGKSITFYLSVLYEEFEITNGKIDFNSPVAGSHIPTAITFDIDNNWNYTLKEYWRPRDGSYYKSDIESKFPENLWEKAVDTQAYNDELRIQIQKQIFADGYS